MIPSLYIVLPCYNEAQVIPETAKRLKIKLQCLIENQRISSASKIVFVNDGSVDQTWSLIQDLHNEDHLFSGINLTRNQGHQNALLAGLMTIRDLCDITISMDVDLQDDIEAIDQMIIKYNEGKDIVYGVREDRNSDTIFKRLTATLYYKLFKRLGGDIVAHHADFRLMSKRALESLAEFQEVNLFLRGIVPLLGFDYDIVLYTRNARFAGKSKYPLKKMLTFAAEGITSFSIAPLRFIFLIGLLSFIASAIVAIFFFIQHFVGHTVSGWSSLIVSIWAIGGLQLLALGIIGEYIAKSYLETKKRPRYLVKEFLNEKSRPSTYGDCGKQKSHLTIAR